MAFNSLSGYHPVSRPTHFHVGRTLLFFDSPLPGDAYSSDAIWRSTPVTFWHCILDRLQSSLPVFISSDSSRTGSVHSPHVQRMLAWPWRTRCRCDDVANLSTLHWCNVTPSYDLPLSRRSVQLGPGGSIGLAETPASSRYPAAEAMSDTDALPGDEFPGNCSMGPHQSGDGGTCLPGD